MGKVKAWLMEMQDYAYECLMDHSFSGKGIDAARKEFLAKYPEQTDIFNEVAGEISRDGSESAYDWDEY